MILVNGNTDDRIDISDRGLQYGDGLFETIAYRNGQTEFLQDHLQRLILGCQRLSIPFKQLEQLKLELDIICQHLADQDAVIKIIITRGSGGRGYLAAPDIEPTRIISTHSLPDYPQQLTEQGIVARFCQHPLSENVRLAGLKHLNRLDQVLARNEWLDSTINEGLMKDQQGNVVEGTMSNLFIVTSGQLRTPIINQSGIAGIIRSQVINLAEQLNIPVQQCQLNETDVSTADEIFVTNSIIGIWPIKELDQTQYTVGSITKKIQSALQQIDK